jgi:TrmH family RNA methyltransferase
VLGRFNGLPEQVSLIFFEVLGTQASREEDEQQYCGKISIFRSSQTIKMLSKANIRFIKSLQVKKYRKQEQCFLVEGAKSVLELIQSDFELVKLVATPQFLDGLQEPVEAEILTVTEKQMEGLGEFQTNNSALAIARLKPNAPLKADVHSFAIVLDDIRDPGNLGTIIRTADWYGISSIIASEETADFYNSKVITASMGSFTRVRIFYTDLDEYLAKASVKVYGAYLNGKDVHTMQFGSGGLIVIGNESRGISPGLEKYITDKITIPRFGKAESLNAAIATAIICDNLRRVK